MSLDYLHERLFEMLLIFDDICSRENISYYLDSGAAIGAVREHGFIPWDDDIDIAIKRADYEKLRSVIGKYLPSNMKLIEPEDYSPLFFDFIPKLINTDIPLRPENEEDRQYHNYQNCASLDFVILDNAPDSAIGQKIMLLKLKMIYGMSMSKRYKVHDADYTVLEKIQSSVCMFIGRFFSMDRLHRMRRKLLTDPKNNDSSYLVRGNSLVKYIGFYPKKYYENEVMLDFNGRKMPLPSDYDLILTGMYGRYMLPPDDREKYVQHADESYINSNKGQ
ncbi:MAG: phosphorylcholine transferase LicD [Oscillospiraceae bacterium]